MFRRIQNERDVTDFLEKVNGLHDGYLIGVSYVHSGHGTGNPHWIAPEKRELLLRYQVTSVWDRIVELRFMGLRDWQIRDDGEEILDCRVTFVGGEILWAEDPEDGSRVRPRKMAWRIVAE